MTKKTIVWLIIGAFLVVLGCAVFGGVMMALKWDFLKLSTIVYETNEYEFSEKIEDISVALDTADLVFVPSNDSKIRVTCYEAENQKHSVSVKDGALVVELTDTRKWYEYIGINFASPKITISLPEGKYGELFVKVSTGDIEIPDISAKSIQLIVSTGNVSAENIILDRNFEIKVSTGRVKLDGVKCESFTSKGSTGDISMKDVVAKGSFSIERNTGDVSFDSCDSAEISVKTTTGNIKGSLLSDKVFITKTDTGSIKVPDSTTGGRCELTTDTGDIKIEIK